LTDNSFRLITLGRLALLRPDGREEAELATQRRKLALLAVLALAERPLSRDTLLEMFWGDQDEARGRHSLSNALSHLRRVLGRDSIIPHQADVALRAGLALQVDVTLLTQAVAADEMTSAVALYEGPFLAGVYVDGSASFEQWVDAHRSRAEAVFVRAAAVEVGRLGGVGDWDGAAALAARWLAVEPLSEDAGLAYLNALVGRGDREADRRALAAYQRHAAALADDFGRKPARVVMAAARAIAERLERSDATGEFRVPAELLEAPVPPVDAVVSAAPVVIPPPVTASPPPATATAESSRRRGILWLVGGLVLGVLATLLLLWRPAGTAAPGAGTIPVVALMDIAQPTGGVEEWLGDGLAQMVATRLSGMQLVTVVEPGRVREVRTRAGLEDTALVALSRSIDLARRVGADWVVTGRIATTPNGLRADLTIHDTRDGQLIRPITVTASELAALAERTAIGLAEAAGRGSRIELAPLGTDNLEAYGHYLRWLRLASEMRYGEGQAALDAAIALDSGFVTALRDRMAMAFTGGETAVRERLLEVFARHADRATPWDRALLAAQTAYYGSRHDEAENLARELVARYPRDPRSYQWLAGVYSAHGRFDEADRALREMLAIDSLAVMAGTGPCVGCNAYVQLAQTRAHAGDLAGAVAAGQRFTELAPESSLAWGTLANMSALAQQWTQARAAGRRYLALSGGAIGAQSAYLRLLIMMREHVAADSGIQVLMAQPSREARIGALDNLMVLERERGRMRAANRVADAILRESPSMTYVNLTRRDSHARLGEFDVVAAMPTNTSPVPGTAAAGRTPQAEAMTGDIARATAWEMALRTDALREVLDTTTLLAMADSLAEIGTPSYYSRDWRLHHHLRGIVAARGGRWDEAAQQFTAAQWGPHGWTRSNVEIARAELARGRPEVALRALRDGYGAPLDAMGRYVPRSMLDWWMAQAHAAAGHADSARVYAGHVRRAWARADPEIRQLLAVLDSLVP
jgi:DNA-binding SARP family transcriptional activator